MNKTVISVRYKPLRWQSWYQVIRQYESAVTATERAYIEAHGHIAPVWVVDLQSDIHGHTFRFSAASATELSDIIDGDELLSADRVRSARGVSLVGRSTHQLLDWLRVARTNRGYGDRTDDEEYYGYRIGDYGPSIPVSVIKTELARRPHVPRRADRKRARQQRAKVKV